MTVINLFFIPVIALYLSRKFNHREIKFGAELVIHYMISCSVVTVLSKLALFVASYVLDFLQTSTASAYFSVVAIAVSVFVALITKIFKADIKEKDKNEKKD